jgi:antitoxin (DNA-binding transcriptional repressor) of toxin-antitoxin stability system
MKTISVRQLREATPRLKKFLEQEGSLLLVSNGEPIARLSPVERAAPARRLPSLKAFRAGQPAPKTPVERLVREERDRR